MQTKTTTKTATKTATKTVTAKPYALILKDALAGTYGQTIQRFYGNALSYHHKKQTAFPRVNDRELIPAKDVPAWFASHATAGIPAGDKTGQRLFDQMVVEAFPGGKVVK